MPYEIRVDLSLLKKAVEAMGAEDLDVTFERLKKGITVFEISDLESKDGLLSEKGHQYILYIQDHAIPQNKFEDAIKHGSKGNRFHLTDECQTIKRMQSENRHERYVKTNDQSGKFVIKGENDETGEAKLQVCRNCLKELNYSGFRNLNNKSKKDRSKKDSIVKEFHIPTYFENYASCFSTLPNRRAGVREDYTDSWEKKSWRHKKEKNFTCEGEGCGVNLSQPDHRKLLHTHHKNGVKRDNRKENLQALCVYCHSEQPGHEHMRTRRFIKSFEQINQLRQEQGISLTDSNPENSETDMFRDAAT